MNETTFTTNGNQLTVIRTFNAPLELVWRAWTEADLLDQWWAPKPWKSITKSMDFKEGGQRIYSMAGPDGEEHWCIAIYTSISVHKHFSGKDAFCNEEGEIDTGLPVGTFHNMFSPEESGTVVTKIIEYQSEEQLKEVIEMGIREGTNMAFENLDQLIIELTK